MGRQMTPESVVGVLHLADRFALMLHTLAGKPLPQLPQAPGRRIVAPPIPTPEEDAAQQDAARIWRDLASDSEGGNHD